ncbi:STAS/SEC14 domain-containing protein [Polyangium jinanense]|uniref:STAS/SEC14 domain-containing protein n=1 Tax=Polyangium jinanense TaxID=2829994 RepID=A0A9X3XDZ1_9BACT|nr:STAS/SEC14 domain-containing protein [Polyangium jinanense]MDC3959180.1 STAS/SEC14 domain-containing protein [Polyangium jinanense]MDC3987600.1 STAS/SEC14 domain-containing protein [Polyangium jinanense]
MHTPDVSFLSRTFRIGPHQARFEPPALLIIEVMGPVSKTDASAIKDLLHQVGDRVGSPYDLLAEVSRMGSFEPHARAVFRQVERKYPLRRVAIAGPSFTTRALLEMVERAGRVLFSHFFEYTVGFFANIEEARRWLAEPPPRA